MAKTWILVGDSSRARLLLAEHTNAPLQELDTLENPAARLRNQDLSSDGPGRSFDSAGRGRHAMEQRESPKHHEAATFARHLAERLEQARGHGELERLVLVAPPRFLGLLRDEMGTDLSRLVIAEIDKDLTAVDASELRTHLEVLV